MKILYLLYSVGDHFYEFFSKEYLSGTREELENPLGINTTHREEYGPDSSAIKECSCASFLATVEKVLEEAASKGLTQQDIRDQILEQIQAGRREDARRREELQRRVKEGDEAEKAAKQKLHDMIF